MEVPLHSAHRGRGQEPVRGQRQRQRRASARGEAAVWSVCVWEYDFVSAILAASLPANNLMNLKRMAEEQRGNRFSGTK